MVKAAFKLQSSSGFESAVGGKMLVLDYFQLGLENVKLFEIVDRPNTTHKIVIM